MSTTAPPGNEDRSPRRAGTQHTPAGRRGGIAVAVAVATLATAVCAGPALAAPPHHQVKDPTADNMNVTVVNQSGKVMTFDANDTSWTDGNNTYSGTDGFDSAPTSSIGINEKGSFAVNSYYPWPVGSLSGDVYYTIPGASQNEDISFGMEGITAPGQVWINCSPCTCTQQAPVPLTGNNIDARVWIAGGCIGARDRGAKPRSAT